MDRGVPSILAHLAEELLHFAGGLIHVDDFARPAAEADPGVRDFARKEDALTTAQAMFFIADFKVKLSVDDVDPFILIEVQ